MGISREDIKTANMIYELWKSNQKGTVEILKREGNRCEYRGLVLGVPWYGVVNLVNRVNYINKDYDRVGKIEINDMERLIRGAYEKYYVYSLSKFNGTSKESEESYIELLKRIESDIKRSNINSVILQEILEYELRRYIKERKYKKNEQEIEEVAQRIEGMKEEIEAIRIDKREILEKIRKQREIEERKLNR